MLQWAVYLLRTPAQPPGDRALVFVQAPDSLSAGLGALSLLYAASPPFMRAGWWVLAAVPQEPATDGT